MPGTAQSYIYIISFNLSITNDYLGFINGETEAPKKGCMICPRSCHLPQKELSRDLEPGCLVPESVVLTMILYYLVPFFFKLEKKKKTLKKKDLQMNGRK